MGMSHIARPMLQITINILLAIHVVVSLLMLLVVLMQRPKSEGLGSAFGGGMTENIFGAQTTNVLTKFTVYLGCAFFALTLLVAILISNQSKQTGNLQKELMKPTADAAAESEATGVVAETQEADAGAVGEASMEIEESPILTGAEPEADALSSSLLEESGDTDGVTEEKSANQESAEEVSTGEAESAAEEATTPAPEESGATTP